jgi:ATP/maltotriose-dependent transcriptional regulator MalT
VLAAPRRQIARDRLIRTLLASPIGLIEAGAGYGKSVLARQYQQELGVATAFVPAGPPDDDPAVLMGSVRRALMASRLSDLTSATNVTDPGAGVERLLDALAALPVPLLVVLDDAHHLRSAEAAGLVLRLARGLPAPHRLLVAARRLAPGLEPLRTLPGGCLDTRALEFTRPEASALVSACRGAVPSDWEVRVLLEATRGWATALVLAASSGADLAGLAPGQPRGREDVIIAPLLAPILGQLGQADRGTVAQLAHLPLVSAELADAVSGTEGTLARIIAAGFPMARTPAGWWEMPGPVVTHLTAQGSLAPGSASAAAACYERAGDLPAALRTLLAAGLTGAAARMLAGASVTRVEDTGWATVRDMVTELPADAVEQHPRVLLHLARLAETAHRNDIRSDALGRAARILGEQGNGADQAFLREVDAERARDLMWDDRTRAQAKALATSVVAGAEVGELAGRARALDVLGRLASWFSADGVRPEAEGLLLASAGLARRIGQRTWEAQALVAVAMGFYYALCRNDRALATLDEVLAQLPARSTYRALVQSFRSDVLIELGRFAEAEACIEEMRELGTAYREEWVLAYAAWSEAGIASYSGDRSRTVRAVIEGEAHRDVWYEQASGVEFLACASDYLGRVGEHELALETLARAQQRMARCGCSARRSSGGPVTRRKPPGSSPRRSPNTTSNRRSGGRCCCCGPTRPTAAGIRPRGSWPRRPSTPAWNSAIRTGRCGASGTWP